MLPLWLAPPVLPAGGAFLNNMANKARGIHRRIEQTVYELERLKEQERALKERIRIVRDRLDELFNMAEREHAENCHLTKRKKSLK